MSHIIDDLDFYTECIDRGQWFMIWKQNWAVLFEYRPEWIRHFPKELWEEAHWRAAVKVLPELAAESPFELKEDNSAKQEKAFVWDTAGKKEKVKYVMTHPEFYERVCQEEELEIFDRILIFDANPELAENFDWTDIQTWSLTHRDRDEVGFYWSFLLNSHPQFAPCCPCLQDLCAGAQAAVLRYRSEYMAGMTIKWQEFSSEEWRNLLTVCPRFADKCDWNRLETKDLHAILQAQPCLIELADCSCFTADIWLDVLLKKPEYITRCPEEMLPELDWCALLLEHPDLYHCFPAEKYRKWSEIAAIKSDYLDDCPWKEISGNELEQILLMYPEYIDKVSLGKLSGSNWTELLIVMPGLAKYCRWGKLKGEDWVRLILNSRGFAKLCPWDKLTGEDWVWLIIDHPHYFRKCPKNKLKKQAWIRLMVHVPQLGKHCPYWNSFNEDQWRAVLKYHGDHAWRCSRKMRPKLAEEWFWKAADQWHLEHDQ